MNSPLSIKIAAAIAQIYSLSMFLPSTDIIDLISIAYYIISN